MGFSRNPADASDDKFKSLIFNIAATKYLIAVNKFNDSYRSRSEQYLTTDYLQFLGRNYDGSYSQRNKTGDSSIWNTAFAAKLLGHSADIIMINFKHILEALNFVSKRQQPDGSFISEPHNYKHISSETQRGIPLTAFCAIAFLENKNNLGDQFKPIIDKALSYIDSKLASLDDNLALAIAAYAFALNKHEETSSLIYSLKENAIQNNGQMFWYREERSLKNSDSPSANVEIAAYALMAFVEAGQSFEAIPIMNWLKTQINSYEGFSRTIDTFIGLQALAKIATSIYSPYTSMEVKIRYEKDRQKVFNINQRNVMTLQTQVLEKDTRHLQIEAKGEGISFVKVSYRYNIFLDTYSERFLLTAVPTVAGSTLTVKICASFIPDGDITQSKMTIIEVYLPSGYVYDPTTSDFVRSVGVRVRDFKNQIYY